MENNIPQGNTSMPVEPEVAQSGNGMKITIGVILVAVLGGLGWFFFTKINVIPPLVVPNPVMMRTPIKNLAPSTGAPAPISAAVSASADMNDLTAIEGDMKNIDATADVNTSDIQ